MARAPRARSRSRRSPPVPAAMAPTNRFQHPRSAGLVHERRGDRLDGIDQPHQGSRPPRHRVARHGDTSDRRGDAALESGIVRPTRRRERRPRWSHQRGRHPTRHRDGMARRVGGGHPALVRRTHVGEHLALPAIWADGVRAHRDRPTRPGRRRGRLRRPDVLRRRRRCGDQPARARRQPGGRPPIRARPGCNLRRSQRHDRRLLDARPQRRWCPIPRRGCARRYPIPRRPGHRRESAPRITGRRTQPPHHPLLQRARPEDEQPAQPDAPRFR